MAEALIALRSPEKLEASPGFWPVDKVIASYLAAVGLMLILFYRQVPGAWWLLTLHASGLALLFFAMNSFQRWSLVFRHWYPLPYVAACYKEMTILIPAVRRTDMDVQLAHLDFVFWGVHPTVWLERIQTPALTEILQILYSLFVPAVLFVAFLLWRQKRFEEFRRYAFLIAVGFLASYIGYFLVPARGPRFLLDHIQTVPLRGLWTFEFLRTILDRLESVQYDCFPSGHTELTILAWWGSRAFSPMLSRSFLIYTLCIVFATVYLRYHYTIDVLAGVLFAVALILAAPYMYRSLGTRGR